MKKEAGFILRFLAFSMDVFILTILLLPITYLISYFKLEIYVNFIYFIILWLYYSLLESSKLQGTLGKYILKIKVVDYNYNKINFNKATLRYISTLLSSMLLFIGYLMIIFTKKKQTLHDIISKTLVIRK